MDESFFNLSDLFKSPFGPDHPRNRDSYGPCMPKYEDIPTLPKRSDIEKFVNGGIKPIFYPNLPREAKMKKQQNTVDESQCPCGAKLKPIVVEVSFKLKNPELTYVGDIFLEYCPVCQDEQFLALACKEASHKFLTNITQKKK